MIRRVRADNLSYSQLQVLVLDWLERSIISIADYLSIFGECTKYVLNTC
jgi:hypothetical protein